MSKRLSWSQNILHLVTVIGVTASEYFCNSMWTLSSHPTYPRPIDFFISIHERAGKGDLLAYLVILLSPTHFLPSFFRFWFPSSVLFLSVTRRSFPLEGARARRKQRMMKIRLEQPLATLARLKKLGPSLACISCFIIIVKNGLFVQGRSGFGQTQFGTMWDFQRIRTYAMFCFGIFPMLS